MSEDIELFARLKPNQRAFLAAYAECGNVRAASRAAKVSDHSHYVMWRDDANYQEAFKLAHELACDALEFEARRRAVEGTKRGIWYKGRMVGTEFEYSDALLMFLLRAERRAKFNPSKETPPDGQAVQYWPKAYVGVDEERI